MPGFPGSVSRSVQVATPSSDVPTASWPDIRRLLLLCTGYLGTPLIPSRFDRSVVEAFVRLHRFASQRKIERLARKMSEVLDLPADGAGGRVLAEEHYRMRIEDGWGRLRGLHPRGWTPKLEFEGMNHLRQGLDAGAGVILWGMSFCGNIVAKQALAQAGMPLVHLSRVDHGTPRPTRLGIGVVAPFSCRAENQYLERRIQIPLSKSLGYLRELSDCLSRNACVSIMGEHSSRQAVTVEVFGRPMKFGTGAPSLAWRHGSALLPVCPIRRGPFHYRIVIEEPIEVDQQIDRKQFVQGAVEEFAARLQRRISDHPSDWHGWQTDRI